MNSFYIVSLFILLNYASEIKCWSDDEQDYHALHQKYRELSSQKKMYTEHFITFLRVVEKNAVEDASEQVLSFDLTLSRQELNDITAALNSRTPDHVISLLGKVRPRYSWSLRIFDTITDLVKANKTMSYILAVTFSVFLLLIYWLHLSKSWLSACSKMFALVFILSVVVTTCRKYEEQLVKKKVFLQNGVPLSCRPQDQGYMYSMWLFVKSMFSVQEDECLKYYEAELINPLLGFTLSEAISETFARFILTPFPIIFEYLGQAILKFFQVLPPFLWIPASVMGLVIYLIANRYRIRTILGSLEPADSLSFNQMSLPSNRWPNSPMTALPADQNHLQGNAITAKGKNIQIMFADGTKTKTLTLKETASVPERKLDFLKQDHAVTGTKPLCLPATETQNKIQINIGDNSIIISQGPEEDLFEPTITEIGMKVEHNDNTSRSSSSIGRPTEDSTCIMTSPETPNSSAENKFSEDHNIQDNNMSTGSLASAKEHGVTSDKSHLMRKNVNKFVTPFKERCCSLYLFIHLYLRIIYQKAQNWNERSQPLHRLFSFLKKYIISTALILHNTLQMVLSKIKFQLSGQISRSQLYSEPKLNMAADEQCRYSNKSINRCERELSFVSPSTSTLTTDFGSAESKHTIPNPKPNFERSRSSRPTSKEVLKEMYQRHLASTLSTLFFGIHQNYAKTLIQGIDAQSVRGPLSEPPDCDHGKLDENSGTKLSSQESSEYASELVHTQVRPRSHKDNSFLENHSEGPRQLSQLKMSSPNFRSRVIVPFYILYGKCHKLSEYAIYHIRNVICSILLGFQLVGKVLRRSFYILYGKCHKLSEYAIYHIRNVICSILVGFQLVGKVLRRSFYKFKMAVMYVRLSVHNWFLANVSVIAHIILCSITVVIYICIRFMFERLLIYFAV